MSRPAGVLWISSAGLVVILLFECYIRSEPERRGYRKRLLDLWKPRNINNELTEVTEQRLADQVRQIKNKKWLETVEQEEIAIRVKHEHQEIETTELHATDTADHTTTSDTQEEHQREEERRVFTAEELQEEISPELEALCDRILEIIQLQQRIAPVKKIRQEPRHDQLV